MNLFPTFHFHVIHSLLGIGFEICPTPVPFCLFQFCRATTLRSNILLHIYYGSGFLSQTNICRYFAIFHPHAPTIAQPSVVLCAAPGVVSFVFSLWKCAAINFHQQRQQLCVVVFYHWFFFFLFFFETNLHLCSSMPAAIEVLSLPKKKNLPNRAWKIVAKEENNKKKLVAFFLLLKWGTDGVLVESNKSGGSAVANVLRLLWLLCSTWYSLGSHLKKIWQC